MSSSRKSGPPPPFGWKQAGRLLFYLALSGVAFGMAFADATAEVLGVGHWEAVAIFAVAFMIVFPAVIVGVLILFLSWKNRRLRSEAYEFGLVRKVAAPAEGAVVRFAEVTAWVAEPDEHPPLLRDAHAVARARFAALLPALAERPPAPLRVVCFESKRHLETYGRKLGIALEGLDGVYLHSRPQRVLAYAEIVPRRPTDPARLLRMLFANAFTMHAKGFLMPTWLSLAVSQVVGGESDRGLRRRLNRKVLALRARAGPEEQAWVFHARGLRMGAWLRAWRDFETYTRLARLFTFGRSLGEFLGGELATPERRERFRAFVTELGRRDDTGRAFERHFGYGFERLMHDWGEAVEALGVGEHDPPPPHIREALLNRMAPLVEEDRADPWERVRAMRAMADAGYPLGADALIRVAETEAGADALGGVQEAPHPVLRREAVSALELISGLALGEDARRWWDWWRGLPTAAVPVGDTAIRAADQPGPG